MILRNVRYKSENIIIQQLNTGSNGVVVIHGGGHSVSVDENNKVTFADPLFIPPTKNTDYGKCTVMTVYFPKTCEGLEAAGKELADFINHRLGEFSKVILHGHSKCGCCFLNLAQWLTRHCTIVSVSAPLKGTPVADLRTFSSQLSAFKKFFYLKIFSDHNVDRDICPGSKFIRNMEIVSAISHHNCHIVASKCGRSCNPIDWVLSLVDKLLGINGDGIVPLTAQLPPFYAKCKIITASHGTSLHKSIRNIGFFNQIIRK